MSESEDLPAGTFLQRWSQRKRSRRDVEEIKPLQPQDHDAAQLSTAAQPVLPAIDSLHEDSDIGMFLRDEVSEALKHQALRKIFHMEKFNVCDGLDDYAENYTNFAPLGDIVTAFQRLQQEREELARQQALDDADALQQDLQSAQSRSETAAAPDQSDTDDAQAVVEDESDNAKTEEG